MDSSDRLSAARARVSERRSWELQAVRLLVVPLLVLVILPSLSQHPRPALHGAGLAVTLSLAVIAVAFIATMVFAVPGRSELGGDLALLAMAAGAVALTAAQPTGTGEITLSVVGYTAGRRLSLRSGLALLIPTTAGTVAALLAGPHTTTSDTASTIILAVLLFLMARLFRRAEEDRERAELATAALADARERELASATLTERSRIARELHDVLAHSLSGLALQLEGARLTAQSDGASPSLVALLERCRRLAADGLADARAAVQALRDEEIPRLQGLVDGFRERGLDVELSLEGDPEALPAHTRLALYRATQEALTNVTRHSSAAAATVDVAVTDAAVRLAVVNRTGDAVLSGVGAGYGLSAMRERAELLGGRVQAGADGGEFRVEVELPR